MRVEYAITAGEGILLDYGTWWSNAGVDGEGVYLSAMDWSGEFKTHADYLGATLIARPCSDDCETGK